MNKNSIEGRRGRTSGHNTAKSLCVTFSVGNATAQDTSPAATIPELEALRGRHDKAQESAHEDAQAKLSRLNEEYLQSLDDLIGQLTRQRKLASTLAVRAERNRLLSIMAGNAANKKKAERDGSRLEESSPASRPMLRNTDYIYLCDLSVISAQADRL